MSHAAPRKLNDKLGEFWLQNPFDFQRLKGFNLSMFERNRLFLNQGEFVFADLSYASGTDLDADSRTVAVGDLNEDGRPDLIVRSVGGGPLRILLNRFPNDNSLQVTLRGSQSNRDGIGARLVLECGGRTLHRDQFPANSYSSQSANETIFGLSDYRGPLKLTITWPSGAVQVLENLKAGRMLIEEPASTPQ